MYVLSVIYLSKGIFIKNLSGSTNKAPSINNGAKPMDYFNPKHIFHISFVTWIYATPMNCTTVFLFLVSWEGFFFVYFRYYFLSQMKFSTVKFIIINLWIYYNLFSLWLLNQSIHTFRSRETTTTMVPLHTKRFWNNVWAEERFLTR